MTSTTAFSAFGVEPFPTIEPSDDLAAAITTALRAADIALHNGDVVIIASKVVSIAEKRYADLASVTPGPEALELSARTGKPATIVQLILDESVGHFLATERGPIIATHRLGYRLTSAGIDRAGAEGAWLLPADPDASALALRDSLSDAIGADLAVVIADSDGRADRRGATVISIGAAGVAPLRVSKHTEGGRTNLQPRRAPPQDQPSVINGHNPEWRRLDRFHKGLASINIDAYIHTEYHHTDISTLSPTACMS